MNMGYLQHFQFNTSNMMVYGLCAVAFFMPWWPTGMEWMLLLLCGVGLLDCYRERFDGKTLPWYAGCWIAFAGWALVTTRVAPTPSLSVYNYFHFLGAYLAMYLLVFRYLRHRWQVQCFLICFLAGAAVVALWGIHLYVGEVAKQSLTVWTDAERFPLLRRRMYSTLGNPNLLGAYLLMAIGMVGAILLTAKQKMIRGLAIFLLAIWLPVLALTYSRGAWVSGVAMVTLLAVLRDRRFLGVLVMIPVFLLCYHGQLAVRLWSLFSGTDTSVMLRYAFWHSTWQMILDHPWLGVGWGAYWEMYPRYDYFVHNADVIIYHAHNMYLNMASETGLFGLALFLAAFIGHGWGAWQLYRNATQPLEEAVGLGMLLVIIGLGVNGVADYNLFNRTVGLAFWTLAAVTAAVWKNKKQKFDCKLQKQKNL